MWAFIRLFEISCRTTSSLSCFWIRKIQFLSLPLAVFSFSESSSFSSWATGCFNFCCSLASFSFLLNHIPLAIIVYIEVSRIKQREKLVQHLYKFKYTRISNRNRRNRQLPLIEQYHIRMLFRPLVLFCFVFLYEEQYSLRKFSCLSCFVLFCFICIHFISAQHRSVFLSLVYV